MSYSTDIKEKLGKLRDKNKYCAASFSCGMLAGTSAEGPNKTDRLYRECAGYILDSMDTEQAGAFLRGVFVSCGTVTDPKKRYHLEILPPADEAYDIIWGILLLCGLMPKEATRKGVRSIYFKESEQIEDFLSLIGAKKETIELINLKIMRDFRNNANRARNCEDANITRLVDASSRHRLSIEKIGRTKGLESLPMNLYDAALLRRDFPEDSIAELAARAVPPVTKSGMAHRLEKICEIADKI